MTASSLFGVAAALGLVLALVGVALRLLGRYARVGGRSGGAVPMEVVARLGLGPRQGLAVVRIGERAVVVSLGEGGVRPVTELSEAEWSALERVSAAPASLRIQHSGEDLRRRLWGTLRRVSVVLALASAAVLAGAGDALAQQPLTGGAGAVIDTAGSGLPQLDLQLGSGEEGGLHLSGTVGAVLVIGALTLLPTLLLLCTSFARILIVLHFLRQAIGAQNAPPAHLLAGLALLLTGFVMMPTLNEINARALQPWMDGQMAEGAMLKEASQPLREFMLAHTSDSDLGAFLDMSRTPAPETIEEVPFVVLVSAFAIGELRAAFQIGFVLFLPFVIIDLVVASVLTSMGMFMLPPTMIALPCKLMLFVLVDGWSLVVQSLVSSFA